ncbi:unnamed protein product, partial [Rotaria sp. Silwood1]
MKTGHIAALTRDQKYKMKINLKRLTSKSFDKKYRKKKAIYQAIYRRNKKQERLDEQTTMSSTSSVTTDRRKNEGQRRRRANINKLKNENTKLRERMLELEKEMKQLKSSSQSTNEDSLHETPTSSPTKLLISSLSPPAKKRATLRMMNRKEGLQRGTISSIRRKFGINLSNTYSPPSSTPSQLEEAIQDFMCRDDVSKLCPDKKKQINHHQIRYRLNHLTVLHQQFETETKIDVDYHTFRRYVPSFIVKPKVDGWGTCLCICCLNPQIKLDKLNQLVSTKPIIKQLLNSMPVDLNELKGENFSVTYNEWQKIKTPGSSSTVSKKVPLVVTIEDFNLEQHLERIHQQFKAAKQAKIDAQQSDDTATMQIDWAENYCIRQAQEEKGAYYFENHVSLHSGYVWLKNNAFSFCSMSNCTNHMAEAAWCSIKDLLDYLINDQQKKQINIISDSPSSQYRNKTTIYMLNRYATKHNITMRWIFLECGHGKGVADAISAQMKRKMDECISFNPTKSYEKSLDFVREIQNSTSIKLFIYDQSHIDEIKKQIPRTLQTVKGTAEFHEVIAEPTGLVFGKKTSDQPQ